MALYLYKALGVEVVLIILKSKGVLNKSSPCGVKRKFNFYSDKVKISLG